MSDSPASANPPIAKSPVQSRGVVIILVAMIFVFLLVIWQRNRIRGYWWAHQIKSTTDITQQAYFIACLASIRDEAEGGVTSLVHDPREEIRLTAIPASQDMSPARRVELVLLPLFLSDDEDVAAAAATAIAFSHWEPGDKILLSFADSDHESLAVAAAVGLARIDSDAATAALCNMVLNHKSPKARAQAIESLAGHLQEQSNHIPANDEPIAVLVSALSDTAAFTGSLAIEREIESVSAAVTAKKGMRVTTSDSIPSPQRRVADVAAAALSQLTGHDIPAKPVDSADQPRFIDECKAWIARHPSPIPTTLPTP